MSVWAELVNRLRYLARRTRFDDELGQEIQFHIEERASELQAAGLSHSEALTQARREFGSELRMREETREAWQIRTLEDLLADVRFGARMLAKSPAVAAVAVLTLALGIGANAAIFSVLHAVLLRPLPYREPDRLASLTQFVPKLDTTVVPARTYLTWRERSQSFEDVAAFIDHLCDANLTGAERPERVSTCAEVTPSLFSVLGVSPALGRAFLPVEGRPGGEHVLLLGNTFWKNHFTADPDILGKTVGLDGTAYIVVGILPGEFAYPGGLKPDVLTPLVLPSEDHWDERNLDSVKVIARLKSRTTIEQAKTELEALDKRIERDFPARQAEMMAGAQLQVLPLHDALVADIRPALLVLSGAVGFVLLIACSNVANILLVRATARGKEIAVRAALGASRARIARQLLTEGILLASFAAVAGLLVAWGAIGLIHSLRPEGVDFASIHLDSTVLVFALILSVATGLLCSLAPILSTSKPDLQTALKEGGAQGGGTAPGRQSLRSILVTVEMALSLVLLVGATLLMRSFVQLMEVNPGFNPSNVLTLQVTLTEAKYSTMEQRRAFFRTLLEEIRQLPGVEAIGGATSLPFYYGLSSTRDVVAEEDFRSQPEPITSVPVCTVSPGYFQAMGVPLVAGRFFEPRDSETAPSTAVVNGEFVRKYLVRGNPIGRHLRFTRIRGQIEQDFTIVGVVGDVRYLGLDHEASPVVFTSSLQFPVSAMTLAVRSRTNPLALVSAIRAVVQKSDPEQPIYHVATMEQRIDNSLSSRRFNTVLLGIFAAVAIVLAGVGIYGVMSSWVTQRNHEIAIRVALGAMQRDVLFLVLGQASVLTLLGVGFGTAGGLFLVRFMRGLLYGVRATDAPTFAGVAFLLMGAALLASFLPARRAMKLDPIVALRCE